MTSAYKYECERVHTHGNRLYLTSIVRPFHASKLSAAALTALSVSSAPMPGTCSTMEPVVGSRTANILPEAAGSHSPAIYPFDRSSPPSSSFVVKDFLASSMNGLQDIPLVSTLLGLLQRNLPYLSTPNKTHTSTPQQWHTTHKLFSPHMRAGVPRPRWLGRLSSCLLKSISRVQFSPSAHTRRDFFMHKNNYLIAESARA